MSQYTTFSSVFLSLCLSSPLPRGCQTVPPIAWSKPRELHLLADQCVLNWVSDGRLMIHAGCVSVSERCACQWRCEDTHAHRCIDVHTYPLAVDTLIATEVAPAGRGIVQTSCAFPLSTCWCGRFTLLVCVCVVCVSVRLKERIQENNGTENIDLIVEDSVCVCLCVWSQSLWCPYCGSDWLISKWEDSFFVFFLRGRSVYAAMCPYANISFRS